MIELIKQEYYKKFYLIATLSIMFGLLYAALCFNSFDNPLHNETDNMDFILPVVIVIIIFKNFKYLKNRKDCIAFMSLPTNKHTVFKVRYFVSLLQILTVFVFLLFCTLPLFLVSNGGIVPLLDNGAFFSHIFYYISLFVKLLFCFLLFNFFLYFFLKGQKVADGCCYVILSVVVMSLVNSWMFFMFEVDTDVTFFSVLSPMNIFHWIGYIYDVPIFDLIPRDYTYIAIIYLSLFSILSIISIPLIIIKQIKFNLENVGKPNNDKVYKIILFILSITTILLTTLFINNYNLTVTISLTVNTGLFIMYSVFIDRFKPTETEIKIYLALFIVALFLPIIL